MKYKKYLFILLLTMIIGVNNTYAYESKKCNYINSDGKSNAQLTVKWGFSAPILHNSRGGIFTDGYSEVTVNKAGQGTMNNREGIINWYSDHKDKSTGLTLNRMYQSSTEANKGADCPEYIIVRTKDNYKTLGVFATNSLSEAKQFVNSSEETGKFHAWYLRHKNSDGSEITAGQYYSNLTGVKYDPTTDTGGKDVTVDCNAIFGSKDDPDSLRYLIDEILQYPRIIVPILVLILGMLDLGKAVIAGKEDEMKKAQKTFIKRLIIGVAFFFIPIFVDIIMSLADIVWQGLGYTSCSI